MTLNLHSHSTSDLSRNHKVLDELTSLVEQVCDSTEVSTERCAFTTSSAAASRAMPTNSVAANRSSGLNQSGAEFPCSGKTNAQLDRDEQEGASQCSPSRSVSQSDPQIQFTPRVLSPEELAQADDAFHFDLRSDFDNTPSCDPEEYKEEI